MIERLLAGEAALARDELEVAERLFSQIADADPRNAIALVGQARVAIRQGDRVRARTLAERALEIDPDEAAATRLLAQFDAPLEPEPAPGSDPEPTPASAEPPPVPAAPQAFEPAPAKTGWRGWLARLLRRG